MQENISFPTPHIPMRKISQSEYEVTSGNLNSCLAEIDKQAEDMFFQLETQMAEREYYRKI